MGYERNEVEGMVECFQERFNNGVYRGRAGIDKLLASRNGDYALAWNVHWRVCAEIRSRRFIEFYECLARQIIEDILSSSAE